MASLRVVTANAASGRDGFGRHDVAGWVGAAAALQAQVDADVWAVQEVDRSLPRSGEVDQATALVDGLGPGWSGRFAAAVHGTPASPEGVRRAAAGDGERASYGVALVTRLPVLAWDELHLDPSSASIPVPLPPGAPQRVLWVADEPRVALACTVQAAGAPVTVLSTHLSFAPTRAVKQLREVVRWARRKPGPLVLAGDLNLPRGVAAWASGMTAAEAGASYPSASPRVQLDQVLVRGGSVDDASTHPCGSSDHLAVAATVHLDQSMGPVIRDA